jgi:hypothetical protein
MNAEASHTNHLQSGDASIMVQFKFEGLRTKEAKAKPDSLEF